jgi:hypothetical protein
MLISDVGGEMARKKSQEGPKRGRPPRHKDRPLAKIRGFRLLGDLDQQLQDAAAKSKRSISQECEYRLSRSFYDDALAAGYLGDDVSADVIRMLRLVMAIESLRGPWSKDPISAQNVRAAADTIIAILAGLPPDPSKGTSLHWGIALSSILMFARSTAWQAAMPPELQSFAEHAEKMLLKLDAARREQAK